MITEGCRKMYDEVLARIQDLPEGSGRSALMTLAEVSKPLSRGLHDNELRLVLGSAAFDLKQRSSVISPSTGTQGLDGSERPIGDMDVILYDISGCLVTPWQCVVVEDKIYADDFRSMSHDWRRTGWQFLSPQQIGFYGYNSQENHCVIDISSYIEADDQSIYFLFNSYQSLGNFGHFIHDTLAQISAYDHLCQKFGARLVPILMGEFVFPMQKFLFEQLVGPGPTVHTRHGVHRFKQCYTANMMMVPHEDKVAISSFRYLRARLQDIALKHGVSAFTAAQSKLYLNRKDTRKIDSRSFSNLGDIEAIIGARRFASLVIGDLAIEEVLSAFYNCEEVVGIHGAGMLNPLFAKIQPKIVELWGYPISWRSIAIISWACGFEHHVVRSEAPREGELAPRISLDRLAEALSS
ncbi:glycosyltransferase 61 family protein [Rhizobium sp.]